MFVPILQGLFREAWEVDDTLAGVHSGADGFIEDVEGWAFASAVLPRIDSCDTAAAATVVSPLPTPPPPPPHARPANQAGFQVRNMKMRFADSDPAMVRDGYAVGAPWATRIPGESHS